MAGSTVSLAEQALAKRILRALGMPTKWQRDPQNVLAIAAWLRVNRQMTGGRFNNIFALGPTAYSNKYVRPKFKTFRRNGRVFYKFPSLTAAIKEMVRILTVRNKRVGDPLRYSLRTLRFGRGHEFLIMLAMADWVSGNYGTPPGGNPSLSRLMKMRGNLKALAQVIQKLIKRKAPPAPYRPTRPKSLPPPPPPHPYLQGFAVGRFYAARHTREVQ